jgi:hypothetical protein
LIDAQFARALHLIRRIRNSFAHEATGVKLDSGVHRDRIKELVAPLAPLKVLDETKSVFFPDKKGATADFYATLAVMVLSLDYLFHAVKQVDNTEAIEFIPPIYNEADSKTRK